MSEHYSQARHTSLTKTDLSSPRRRSTERLTGGFVAAVHSIAETGLEVEAGTEPDRHRQIE